LHHPDLALRNVFFDPTDDTKIVGLIDWGGAQILPLMFTAVYPADLFSTGEDPWEREGIPDEDWSTVPHDWTSFGDTCQWPRPRCEENEPVHLTVRANAMMKRYYLRQYFGACFAQENHSRYGDYNPARAMLFAHAPCYLKFHETIQGNWVVWALHSEWIRETYWRVNAGKQELRCPVLIVGPNVYRNSMKTSLWSSPPPVMSERASTCRDEAVSEKNRIPPRNGTGSIRRGSANSGYAVARATKSLNHC
ncbi:hypothetical protein M405DRAFT_846684, partial [Rhizopogon salebrosus TDB-379]